MTGLKASLSRFARRRFRPRHTIRIDDPAELITLAHLADKPALRIEIAPHHLRMQGAFTYGPGHPFVRALGAGRGGLADFHSRCQPRTIAEYYGIEDGSAKGGDLPPWEIPWYFRHRRTPPPGERGLGPEHGISFYGPATDQKIDLEMKRLRDLRESIGKHGYDPDAFGDIEGYAIRDREKVAFFVRGGKHRAAALTHLGYDRIPVAFRLSFPRVVDSAQADYWPLVAAGRMDVSLARRILAVYSHGRAAGDAA